jgi:surface antigen
MTIMKIAKLGAAVMLAGALAACANDPYGGGTGYGTKETVGTLGGAALGGLAGAQFGHGSGQLAATALGVVIGGVIGNQIGRYMDQQDREMAQRAEYAALEQYPDGQQSQWKNPNNGNYGYTQPTHTYQNSEGTYCREYQTTIVVGGQPQSGHGTACREPDGSWRIVS